jgi:hypothetical protein
MESCVKHGHLPGVAICRRCGGAWCHDCLVYAFGPDKDPYCLSCAMVAGGVRSASARPVMPKRELKARQKAAKAEAKAAAKAAKRGPNRDSERPEQPSPGVPAPGSVEEEPTDWDRPWWEDKEPTFVE